MGNLHEANDGYAGAGGKYAGHDPEKRFPRGRIPDGPEDWVSKYKTIQNNYFDTGKDHFKKLEDRNDEIRAWHSSAVQ